MRPQRQDALRRTRSLRLGRPVGHLRAREPNLRGTHSCSYCRSYSPLPIRFRTVNPAFLASEIETGLSSLGVLKVEITRLTRFLQAGQCVSSGALTGRRSVNRPPQTTHPPWPSHTSYSYSGIIQTSVLRLQHHTNLSRIGFPRSRHSALTIYPPTPLDSSGKCWFGTRVRTVHRVSDLRRTRTPGTWCTAR